MAGGRREKFPVGTLGGWGWAVLQLLASRGHERQSYKAKDRAKWAQRTEDGVREAPCFEAPETGGGEQGISRLRESVSGLDCRSGSLLDQVERL